MFLGLIDLHLLVVENIVAVHPAVPILIDKGHAG